MYQLKYTDLVQLVLLTLVNPSISAESPVLIKLFIFSAASLRNIERICKTPSVCACTSIAISSQ
jgi:hypothetical protein